MLSQIGPLPVYSVASQRQTRPDMPSSAVGEATELTSTGDADDDYWWRVSMILTSTGDADDDYWWRVSILTSVWDADDDYWWRSVHPQRVPKSWVQSVISSCRVRAHWESAHLLLAWWVSAVLRNGFTMIDNNEDLTGLAAPLWAKGSENKALSEHKITADTKQIASLTH